MVAASTAVGLPLYLMPLLGTAKLLGAIALVLPFLKVVKEWAYAGFAFIFIGATWVHLATHTPFVAPLVFLGILGVSYWFHRRLHTVVAK
ncbi:MAG TPA: DoxX family protein [Cytophagales bacterium]|nr:DoxX family protein [Cytophagales bacterium]